MSNQAVTVEELLELLPDAEGALNALCNFIGHEGTPKAILNRLADVRARLSAYGVSGTIIPVTGTIGGAA